MATSASNYAHPSDAKALDEHGRATRRLLAPTKAGLERGVISRGAVGASQGPHACCRMATLSVDANAPPIEGLSPKRGQATAAHLPKLGQAAIKVRVVDGQDVSR